MPGDGPRALARLGRVIRCLEAAPAPLADRTLGRALRLATRLWAELFAEEVGTRCGAGRPEPAEAAAALAPCPDARRDPAGHRAWHVAQGRLFLHYAPVAARLLDPGGAPAERATALLLGDALQLLRDHAAELGRDARPFEAAAGPAVPFAALIQRTERLRSGHSADVNLGAVALGLAVESGMRHALDVPAEAPLSMWRLFRGLAEAADEVRLTVELPTLVAAYNWAGRHRRAGRRGHGWLNFLAADLLHPLFVPPAPLGFGLLAAPATLRRLREAATATGPRAVAAENVVSLPAAA